MSAVASFFSCLLRTRLESWCRVNKCIALFLAFGCDNFLLNYFLFRRRRRFNKGDKCRPKEISAITTGRYSIVVNMSCRMTWESVLSISSVDSGDYGAYDCIAQNEMGLARSVVVLNVTSSPDPPDYLRILNVTYNSVNLTWSPGFDGGFPQSFKIRYKKEGADNYQ